MNKIKLEKNNNEIEIVDEWLFIFDMFKNLIDKINLIGYKLAYHQKVRIINKLILYYVNEKKTCKFYYIDEENIKRNNSYYLALNFNKNVINSLREKSILSQGFLQLDGYILKNYCIEEGKKAYSLTNEPLVLMKQHLLSNYENFIFIIYENPINNLDRKASQDKKNGIYFNKWKKSFK